MKSSQEKLTIELYNGSTKESNKKVEPTTYLFSNIFKRVSSRKLSQPNEMELVIKNLVKRRGFEDYVEINSIETKSEKKISAFAIIANKVIKDLNIDSLTDIINEELDNLLYSALKYAKKDYQKIKLN